MSKLEMIKFVTTARVGFLGNPSDGFGGKTISFPLRNFQAEIVLWSSPTLKFILNSEDQDEYDRLEDMVRFVGTNGYYGGIRLIKAAIVAFHKYCIESKIRIRNENNFTISYRSNIPRQSGLSGSSAIIISTIKGIIEFYGLDKKLFPPAIIANIGLSAETEELGIAAGLQDRVVQSFGVPVYMDFSPEAFAKNKGKYGIYEELDEKLFPPMLLAWNNKPSESGKVHSDIKARFWAGDEKVVSAMSRFAEIAYEGHRALLAGNQTKLHELIDANFNLRRKLYGDAVVGLENIKMIDLARSYGAAAKFPGSGGAIIILPKQDRDFDIIISGFRNKGYEIERIAL